MHPLAPRLRTRASYLSLRVMYYVQLTKKVWSAETCSRCFLAPHLCMHAHVQGLLPMSWCLRSRS